MAFVSFESHTPDRCRAIDTSLLLHAELPDYGEQHETHAARSSALWDEVFMSTCDENDRAADQTPSDSGGFETRCEEVSAYVISALLAHDTDARAILRAGDPLEVFLREAAYAVPVSIALARVAPRPRAPAARARRPRSRPSPRRRSSRAAGAAVSSAARARPSS